VETNAIGEEITGTRTLYEPYGTPLTTPRDGAPSYTGHQYDIGTGLIYAQQRYYDPQLGVFMSPDPMAVDTTSAFNFNRYAYANNSPYKFTDPDGRYAEAVLEVASVSVGLASFVNNASSGNYWAASADAVGIAIDGIGLAVPLAPGVAGLGIQASRAADAARNSTIIYRRGDSVETATRLERKATEAEASNIEIHGVSGSTTMPDGPCSAATCGALEDAGFKVHDTPTRADPNHKTIELPKPVTPEDAKKFNEVFGREK